MQHQLCPLLLHLTLVEIATLSRTSDGADGKTVIRILQTAEVEELIKAYEEKVAQEKEEKEKEIKAKAEKERLKKKEAKAKEQK